MYVSNFIFYNVKDGTSLLFPIVHPFLLFLFSSKMLVKLYFAADGLFSIDLVKSYFFPNPIEVPEFL